MLISKKMTGPPVDQFVLVGRKMESFQQMAIQRVIMDI